MKINKIVKLIKKHFSYFFNVINVHRGHIISALIHKIWKIMFIEKMFLFGFQNNW